MSPQVVTICRSREPSPSLSYRLHSLCGEGRRGRRRHLPLGSFKVLCLCLWVTDVHVWCTSTPGVRSPCILADAEHPPPPPPAPLPGRQGVSDVWDSERVMLIVTGQFQGVEIRPKLFGGQEVRLYTQGRSPRKQEKRDGGDSELRGKRRGPRGVTATRTPLSQEARTGLCLEGCVPYPSVSELWVHLVV
ncbi:hypothetical protein mRhiFer1_008579 [Rhinolophus ferrumequinum]|uniref:Uncharacterized protein n=1 Tax=Rhinolophus ferrumequinum TaxID=59479 RepID=A0A7J7UJR7_RHIFE|nr:hypothetical protein mRhiFer1_008579 [Rhinolophus ferrumequinum]